MNKRHIDILQVCEIEKIFGKVQEFDRFIEITRRFSLKCTTHIQKLVLLINNLIDSEEFLNLNINSINIQNHVNTNHAQQCRKFNYQERSSAKLVANLAETIKEEQKRMVQVVRNGQETSAGLKEMLEKLILKVGHEKNTFNCQGDDYREFKERVQEHTRTLRSKACRLEHGCSRKASPIITCKENIRREIKCASLHRPLSSNRSNFSISMNNYTKNCNGDIQFDDSSSRLNSKSFLTQQNENSADKEYTNYPFTEQEYSDRIYKERIRDRSSKISSLSTQLNKTVDYTKGLIFENAHNIRGQSSRKKMPYDFQTERLKVQAYDLKECI